jgi:ankyrin repeat protein
MVFSVSAFIRLRIRRRIALVRRNATGKRFGHLHYPLSERLVRVFPLHGAKKPPGEAVVELVEYLRRPETVGKAAEADEAVEQLFAVRVLELILERDILQDGVRKTPTPRELVRNLVSVEMEDVPRVELLVETAVPREDEREASAGGLRPEHPDEFLRGNSGEDLFVYRAVPGYKVLDVETVVHPGNLFSVDIFILVNNTRADASKPADASMGKALKRPAALRFDMPSAEKVRRSDAMSVKCGCCKFESALSIVSGAPLVALAASGGEEGSGGLLPTGTPRDKFIERDTAVEIISKGARRSLYIQMPSGGCLAPFFFCTVDFEACAGMRRVLRDSFPDRTGREESDEKEEHRTMSMEFFMDAVKRRDVGEALRFAEKRFGLPLPGMELPSTPALREAVLAAHRKSQEAFESMFPELKKPEEPEATEESRLNDLLQAAANAGSSEFVAGLLELGADPNSFHVSGWNPLTLAVSKNHKEVARILLDAGADPNSYAEEVRLYRTDADFPGPETAFTVAVGNKLYKTAKLLLEKGADAGAPGAGGATSLMRAATDGAEDMVELLVEHGADIDAVDERGRTALMHAVEYGQEETCKCLLKRGANPNVQGRGGSTALALAIEGPSSAIVEMLLEHGADTELKGHDGWTALAMASDCWETEKLRMLLLAGASSEPFPEDASREALDEVARELAYEVVQFFAATFPERDYDNEAEFEATYGRFVDARPELSELRSRAGEAGLKEPEADLAPMF